MNTNTDHSSLVVRSYWIFDLTLLCGTGRLPEIHEGCVTAYRKCSGRLLQVTQRWIKHLKQNLNKRRSIYLFKNVLLLLFKLICFPSLYRCLRMGFFQRWGRKWNSPNKNHHIFRTQQSKKLTISARCHDNIQKIYRAFRGKKPKVYQNQLALNEIFLALLFSQNISLLLLIYCC